MSADLFGEGSLYGVLGAFLAELFPMRLRYSGISFGYQVAGIFGGGLAPIVATALIHWSGGAWWPVAMYLAVTALISFVSIYLASELYGVGVHEDVSLRAASSSANR